MREHERERLSRAGRTPGRARSCNDHPRRRLRTELRDSQKIWRISASSVSSYGAADLLRAQHARRSSVRHAHPVCRRGTCEEAASLQSAREAVQYSKHQCADLAAGVQRRVQQPHSCRAGHERRYRAAQPPLADKLVELHGIDAIPRGVRWLPMSPRKRRAATSPNRRHVLVRHRRRRQQDGRRRYAARAGRNSGVALAVDRGADLGRVPDVPHHVQPSDHRPWGAREHENAGGGRPKHELASSEGIWANVAGAPCSAELPLVQVYVRYIFGSQTFRCPSRVL
jgi:hypothetical protein